MSNSDRFFDEVTEDLRRDRMVSLARRYGWIAVLAVLGVVGFASWNEWSKAQAQARAQAFGDAVLAALEPEDAGARRAALAELRVAEATTAAQSAIVALIGAAEALRAGDRAAALAAFQSVADDATLPLSYRQLATLKRVSAATAADLPLAEREALIAPLTAPGAIFRPLALEQQALLRLEAGDRAGAVEILTGLLQDAEATDALRARAQQVIVILGGSAAAAG